MSAPASLRASDPRSGATVGVPARPDGWRRHATVVLSVLLVLPSVVVAVTWTGADWLPTQDFAVLDLRMRSLLTADTPLNGAFSRYGWNHPGPVWYWILAPLYLVTGGAPWSMVVGGALWSVVVLGLGCWIAHRLAGTIGVLAFAVVASFTYACIGGWVTVSPWNPHLALTAFLTFLVAALAWSVGDRWMTPVVLVGATVLVQLHVAYGILVVPVVLWSAVSFARVGGLPRLRAAHRLAAATVAALAVLWLPALVEMVVRPPGNLYRLAAYTVRGSDLAGEPVGFRYAAGVAGYGFRIPPPWASHVETVDLRGWVVPGSPAWLVVGVGLCGGAWLLARHAGLPLRRLVQLAAVALVAVVVAVSRLAGERWSYLVDWRYAVAGLVWVAFFLALASRLRRPVPTRVLAAVALAFVAVVSVARTVDVVADEFRVVPHEDETEALVEEVLGDPSARPRPGTTPVALAFDATLFGLRDGLLNGVRRAGLDVRAPGADRAKYGDDAVVPAGEETALWLVSETSYGTSMLLDQPDTRVLALLTPLDEQEEEALRRLHLETIAALQRAGRLDLLDSVGSDLVEFALADAGVAESVDLETLAELNERVAAAEGCRCAVVATDRPGTPWTAADAAAAPPGPT